MPGEAGGAVPTEALIATAMDGMRRGLLPAAVLDAMRESGVAEDEARAALRAANDRMGSEVVVRPLSEQYQEGEEESSGGLVWLIGGTVLTLGTFGYAYLSGGGSYLIAWGPMAFGLIMFVRGRHG